MNYSLYFCLGDEPNLEEICTQAIQGGVSVIQMREKSNNSLKLFNLAKRFKNVCSKFQIPLIINDRLDIALAIDAEGVHLGQEDIPCFEARKIMKEKIIGISVSSAEEAKRAESEGADYLGVGAMFATQSKSDAKQVSIEELRAIREATSLPIVIIGGLNEENISNFKNMGIEGIAVISAILKAKDRENSARRLKQIWHSKL